MRECYRALIFCDLKAGLNQEECVQWLQLAFGDPSACLATVFRWFKEFHNSLNTGRPQSSRIRKMLMDENRCTNLMIQKEFSIRFATMHKILHEESHMKKVVCR
ncbi:histone-lysine N-methyltransferase SETMAR [Trichonephila clavipes]|nr:histone-lysine N-methyltransferase SETMAR [Trichonephila clavipes]